MNTPTDYKNLADELEGLAKSSPGAFHISAFEVHAGGASRMIMGSDGFSVAHVGQRTEAENAAIANLIVALHNNLPRLLSAIRIEAALVGFADDFMTSDAHHPGYVLIPTAKFEAIRAALKDTRA